MSRTLLVLGYLIVFYHIFTYTSPILGYSHLFFKVDCEYSKKGTVVDPVCFISKHGLRFGVKFTKELNVFNASYLINYANRKLEFNFLL